MCEETSTLCGQKPYLHPPAVKVNSRLLSFMFILSFIFVVIQRIWWRICTFFPSPLICILFYHLPVALTLSQHVSALFLLFMMDHYAAFAAGNTLLTACFQVYASSMNHRLLTCFQRYF